MRKKNVAFLLDHGFWLFLYVLPLLIYLIQLGSFNSNLIPITDLGVFLDSNFNCSNSPVYSLLVSCFANTNTIELFNSTSGIIILKYLSYYVSIQCMHFVIDLITFLPNLVANKMNGSVLKGVE